MDTRTHTLTLSFTIWILYHSLIEINYSVGSQRLTQHGRALIGSPDFKAMWEAPIKLRAEGLTLFSHGSPGLNPPHVAISFIWGQIQIL